MPDPDLPPPCPLCTSEEAARSCRDFLPPGICRRPERLVCDIVRSPPMTLEVLRSEEGLRGLALALERHTRFAVCALRRSLDPSTDSARALGIATEDGQQYLVDLDHLPRLGRVGELVVAHLIVGHGLKPQLASLGDYLPGESRAIFDTALASEVLGQQAPSSLATLSQTICQGPLLRRHVRAVQTHLRGLLQLADIQTQDLAQQGLMDTALLEFSILPALTEMEVRGIAVDQAQWDTLLCTRRTEVEALGTYLSTTLQVELENEEALKAALEQHLHTQLASTSRTDLGLFAAQPLVKHLQRYRRLVAFLQSVGPRVATGLRRTRDGRVRCEIRQILSTGRMASREPNLMGMPRDPEVRRCFIAPPGKKLIIADYKQVELRVAAKVTGDRLLLDSFQTGRDPHRTTAAVFLGKHPDQLTEEERDGAKAVNFGGVFGMGPDGLVSAAAKRFGVSLNTEAAARYLALYRQHHRGVHAWQEQMRRAGNEVRTLGGRARRFLDSSDAFTEKLATVIQGTAADGMKRALAELYWALKPLGAFVVLVIHDAVIVEAPADATERTAMIIESTMRLALSQYIAPVPVEVSITVGGHW